MIEERRMVRTLEEIRSALVDGVPFTFPDDMDPYTAWLLGVQTADVLDALAKQRLDHILR